MHRLLVITLTVSCCFVLCGCTKDDIAVHSANSARLKKLQSEYKTQKDDLTRQAQNKNYTYENDVLKIDMK